MDLTALAVLLICGVSLCHHGGVAYPQPEVGAEPARFDFRDSEVVDDLEPRADGDKISEKFDDINQPFVDKFDVLNQVDPKMGREIFNSISRAFSWAMQESRDNDLKYILADLLERLQAKLNGYSKRGWSRVNVQTRYAPFGTKLVPNRKLENSGATLLRYGRSVQGH
ncbi:uncharacterized protein LOC131930878 [Physella acuta]|uniref:uncharacterized protein LOC131930878 n=1 Tax=Physella acuta TaxID=109671 RepID=UPI0027DAF061|nr:uncharacterized protein LOC131930878 [Physella acuta]